MSVRPVQRSSLVEQTAVELGRLIQEGEWGVGDRVPGEIELGRLLSVGRSTVREALRTLIATGQLEARQGVGTFVASLDAVGDWDRRLRRAAIADVYEVRIALELEAAQLAAVRRTAADLAAMDAALAARDPATDPEVFVDADLTLHRAIVRAAHNPVLADVFESFVAALRGALLALVDDDDLRSPDDRAAATRAHHDLVDAIRDGDAAAAVESTRRNVAATLVQLRAGSRPG